jgi:hypothetical protein
MKRVDWTINKPYHLNFLFKHHIEVSDDGIASRINKRLSIFTFLRQPIFYKHFIAINEIQYP